MTELAHFPQEILSIIFQALDGFDIANLWLSGDTGLRVRMENGGVTRFKLKLRQTRTCKWPTLISRFRRLDYLFVGPFNDQYCLWFHDVDLLGVAPTLKHLKLVFENAEMVLLGIPFVVEDLHPDPIFSPPTYAEMSLAPLPISSHFKELQTLVVIGTPTIPSILVSLLPQTLRRLYLSHDKISADVFSALPPNLTSLEMPYVTILEDVTIFPPNLTRLTLQGLEEKAIKALTGIPATVTDLTLSSDNWDDLWLIDLLPPNLTSLVIVWNFYWPKIAYKRLPQSLRHLDISQSDMTQFLFPSLQSLVIRGFSSISETDIPSLPRTLTKLRIKTTEEVPSDCLKFLPDNLRILYLNVVFSASHSAYPFMRTLEKLYVVAIDAQALISMPRLSKIRCQSFRGTDLSALKTVSRLRKIHLNDDVALSPEFLNFLPDTLEDLAISAKKSLDPSVAQRLPRSLQSLSIHDLTIMSDLFIQHLPPRLTELRLKQVESFSDAEIPLLPRTLQLLSLKQITDITDEGIRHLPPFLTDCRLESAHLLTDKSAALFPRCMTRLYLDSCEMFSNVAVPQFPRTLTALDLSSNAQITKDCFPHLPPLLVFFRTKDAALTADWYFKGSPTSSFIASVAQ